MNVSIDGFPGGALSRPDAARYLSCSTRYLDILARAGEIRRCKLGAKTVYLRAELDKFLASKLQDVRETKDGI